MCLPHNFNIFLSNTQFSIDGAGIALNDGNFADVAENRRGHGGVGGDW